MNVDVYCDSRINVKKQTNNETAWDTVQGFLIITPVLDLLTAGLGVCGCWLHMGAVSWFKFPAIYWNDCQLVSTYFFGRPTVAENLYGWRNHIRNDYIN